MLAGAVALFESIQPSGAQAQLVASGPSTTQATALVSPRSYLLVSNFLMGPKSNYNAGTISNTSGLSYLFGSSVPSWLTNQNVYALAPTLMPNGPAPPIGLMAIIQETNNLTGTSAGASNIVINVYPAYDTSGGSTASVSPRYGQLFGSNAIFTWTITHMTNGTWVTNLPSTLWEPATALGYTISNQCNSNVTLTLIQTDVP
jgi:hypothetical protein